MPSLTLASRMLRSHTLLTQSCMHDERGECNEQQWTARWPSRRAQRPFGTSMLLIRYTVQSARAFSTLHVERPRLRACNSRPAVLCLTFVPCLTLFLLECQRCYYRAFFLYFFESAHAFQYFVLLKNEKKRDWVGEIRY